MALVGESIRPSCRYFKLDMREQRAEVQAHEKVHTSLVPIGRGKELLLPSCYIFFVVMKSGKNLRGDLISWTILGGSSPWSCYNWSMSSLLFVGLLMDRNLVVF